MNTLKLDPIILNALNEDVSYIDVSTEYLIDKNHESSAVLISKDKGILSGTEIFNRTFKLVDEEIDIKWMFHDKDKVNIGEALAYIKGPTQSILMAERTALNFIQRMSGIATETQKYVAKLTRANCKIVDTRKTAPGLRLLDKAAVVDGGGANHRYNLSDAVMIKDNHIVAAGGIRNAVVRLKSILGHTVKIEVEAETLDQVNEAIEAGADIVMLDNMTILMMKEAVLMGKGRVIFEASGNVSLGTVADISETGVSIISVGNLTHSVKAMDLSLKFQ